MLKSILIISSEFPPDTGGIGNHAYHLASSLQKKGYKVTVLADIVHSNITAVTQLQKNAAFKFIAVFRKKIVALTYASRAQQALQLAAKNDIVICSGKFPLWLSVLLKKRFPRKKMFAVVHGSELQLSSARLKKFTDRALNNFQHIIAVSEYTRSFLPATILQKNNCTVIPNGIDINEFKNHIDLNRKIKPLQIITVGSITERKGQENIIRALPAIIKIYPDVVYHMIGLPVIQKELEQLCDALEVKEHVVFHGKLERNEVISMLASATIKMMLSNHTSSGDFEGFGIAILEANALGVPAIASVTGGTRDAVDNGNSGLLVDNKDAAAIVNAIDTILANYDHYAAGTISWAQQHDWKTIVEKYIRVVDV